MTQPADAPKDKPIDAKKAQELSRRLADQREKEDDKFEEGVAKQFETKKKA